MRAKAKQNNTYRQSPGLFSPHVRRNEPLWNHIHPTSSRSAVMADLLRRVGKMLAMRPMTIIPLRRGPPPFTIALVRMFRMNKTAQTWEQTVQRVHSWVHKEHKSTQSEYKIRKKNFQHFVKRVMGSIWNMKKRHTICSTSYLILDACTTHMSLNTIYKILCFIFLL